MKKYKYLIMIFLLLLNVAVEATVVNLATGKHAQIQDGQVFNFNFPNVPLSDGTGGSLFFKARGDYSLGFSRFENITIEIEGGTFGPHGPSASNLIQSFNDEDNE